MDLSGLEWERYKNILAVIEDQDASNVFTPWDKAKTQLNTKHRTHPQTLDIHRWEGCLELAEYFRTATKNLLILSLLDRASSW
jgi:hypothetical protein